jgi:uncharacterized SAM-binding protein YcdF (DUF218 family)
MVSDPMFDAVIVLGAAVWPGGVASPTLRRRTRHGAALVVAGRAPVLILTGGLGKNPPAEAIVMRDIAVEEGVSVESIIVEDRASNTVQSGRLCAAIMRSRGWSRALIVTDDFHMPRTLLIFRWFGVEAAASTAPGARQGSGTARWAFYGLRELVALPWTLVRLIAADRRV